jgi:hypothetical protein
MMVEATLRGENCRLVLRIERYERPQTTTGSDGNWLVGEVELDIGITGSFKARQQVSILTDELESFRDQLQALDRHLTGEATLHHVESQLGATITLKAGRARSPATFARTSALHCTSSRSPSTNPSSAKR